MQLYRAALVWILRLSAVGVMMAAIWSIVEARRAYDAARAYYHDSPAEVASLGEPMMAPVLLSAVLGATVLLAFAEILDALNGRDGR